MSCRLKRMQMAMKMRQKMKMRHLMVRQRVHGVHLCYQVDLGVGFRAVAWLVDGWER